MRTIRGGWGLHVPSTFNPLPTGTAGCGHCIEVRRGLAALEFRNPRCRLWFDGLLAPAEGMDLGLLDLLVAGGEAALDEGDGEEGD